MTRREREAFCEANPNRVAVPAAKFKSHPGNESLVKKGVPRLDAPCHIHLHSKRHRCIDVDNLYGKACIDGLRYSGFIQDDSPEYVTKVTYSQEKISRKEPEETIITITAE